MASDSAIPIATLALAGVLTANALWSEWIRQKSISDLQKHIQAVERKALEFARIIHNSEIGSDISQMWREKVGIVLASGEDLDVVWMNDSIRRHLSLGPDDEVASVYQMLPSMIRGPHRMWIRSCMVRGKLPDSIMHPMRFLDVKKKCGTFQRFHASIGLLHGDLKVGAKPMFYAILAREAEAVPRGHRGESISRWERIAKHKRGPSARRDSKQERHIETLDTIKSENDSTSSSNDEGAETYDGVVTLSLSINRFVELSTGMKPSDVPQWIRAIHDRLDDLMDKHCIRHVQTRADGIVCIAGTQDIPGDLSNDAATRLVRFIQEVHTKLLNEMHITVQAGMCAGEICAIYLPTGQATKVSIFGDAVNRSIRYDHDSCNGYLLMSDTAINKLREEGLSLSSPLPLDFSLAWRKQATWDESSEPYRFILGLDGTKIFPVPNSGSPASHLPTQDDDRF